jgi:acyl-CoA thioesterase YciA
MADEFPDVPGGPHLRTVAMPRDANASGAIFGGWTLSQMDLAGGTFAAQQAKARVATVSIEAMRFLRPVEVGDEVSCYCSLKHSGETSVAIRIETWARSRGESKAEKVTEGVFTYVAVGDDGRPRKLGKPTPPIDRKQGKRTMPKR